MDFESRNLPASSGRYEIKLEVHGAPTKVFLNGEELVTVPPPDYPISPEILLAVEAGQTATKEGEAWFSDIGIEELVAPGDRVQE